MKRTLFDIIGPAGGTNRFTFIRAENANFKNDIETIFKAAEGILLDLFAFNVKNSPFSTLAVRAVSVAATTADIIANSDNETIVNFIIHGSTDVMRKHVIDMLPEAYLIPMIYEHTCKRNGIVFDIVVYKSLYHVVNYDVFDALKSFLNEQTGYWYALLSMISNMFFRVSLGTPIPFATNIISDVAAEITIIPAVMIDPNSGLVGYEAGVVTINPTEPLWIYHLNTPIGDTPYHVVLPEHMRSLLSQTTFIPSFGVIRLTPSQALALGELVLYGFVGKDGTRTIEYWNELGLTPQFAFDRLDNIQLNIKDHDVNFGPLLYPISIGGVRYRPTKSHERFLRNIPGRRNEHGYYQYKLWSESDFRDLADAKFQLVPSGMKYDPTFADFFNWGVAYRMTKRLTNSIDLDMIEATKSILESDAVYDAYSI